MPKPSGSGSSRRSPSASSSNSPGKKHSAFSKQRSNNSNSHAGSRSGDGQDATTSKNKKRDDSRNKKEGDRLRKSRSRSKRTEAPITDSVLRVASPSAPFIAELSDSLNRTRPKVEWIRRDSMENMTRIDDMSSFGISSEAEVRADENNFDDSASGRLLRAPSYEQDTNRDFTGVTFVRSADHSEKNKFIKNYRDNIMRRMDAVLDGIGGAFSEKLIKGENHKQVLKAKEELAAALAAIREVQNQKNTEPERLYENKKIQRLTEALIAMETASIGYINSAQDPTRTGLTKDIVDYIHQLRVTDSKLEAGNTSRAYDVIDAAEDQLRITIGPEAAKNLFELIEGLFYNASPESVAQSSLDSFGVALGLLEQVNVTNPIASDVSTGFGIDSTGAGLAGDLFKAINLIRELNGSDTISKKTVSNGTALVINASKNTATTVKTVIDVSGTTAQTATQVASIAGQVAGVSGAVLGAGFTGHGALLVYKTQTRINAAENIADPDFKNKIIARATTKRRRALLEAVGGTVAVVGGVLSVVGTAGVAAPIIAGIGAVIGGSLVVDRIHGAVKEDTGKKRTELADSLHQHLKYLIAREQYNSAREIVQALTNNKAKQFMMLKGADRGANPDLQGQAIDILRDKLKTW